MTASDPDSIIRITKEEADSSHVDDLLKRQMSLRGDPGVTRDRGRKWYYQNWIVLMLVGILGAVAAWAILECYYTDKLYLQGEISAINPDDRMPEFFESVERTANYGRAIRGSMTIKGEKVFLLKGTRELLPDGSTRRMNNETLRAGDTVGVYTDYFRGRDESLALGEFIVSSPKPQSQAVASLTLDQLSRRKEIAGLLFFSVVAGFIGLFIGATDGIICRLPRRAILCGGIGLLVGFAGGFVCNIAANVIYSPLSLLAMRQSSDASSMFSTLGFVIQMFGRSLAWCMAGVAMGLGQGIALRSKRLLVYGLLGGVVGGLFGGMLFDPIDLILLGPDKPSAHWSRLIGLSVIGASVGAMIGLVELLARDAWLRMTQGPLTGKEFLLFKDVMNIGASPRSDIYLFNDPLVAPDHAVIRAVGDECEIEAKQATNPVLLNNQSVRRARLRHGDSVTIGRTIFVFQRRKG